MRVWQKRVLGVWCSFALSAFLLNHSNAAEIVQFSFGPEASPVMVEILANSQYFKSSIDVTGYIKNEPIKEADCVAKVLRPGEHEQPTRSKENKLLCSFGYKSGLQGSLIWSLENLPIDSWGNRFDRLPFQFAGDPAVELQALIRAAEETNKPTPLLGHWFVCGPNELCTETYFIAHEANEDSRGAILCTRDYERNVPYRAACTFMP